MAVSEKALELVERFQRNLDVYKHTDKQIDTLVYALYGLTKEKIAIVEGTGLENPV